MGNCVIDYEAEGLKPFDKLYRLVPLAESDIAKIINDQRVSGSR